MHIFWCDEVYFLMNLMDDQMNKSKSLEIIKYEKLLETNLKYREKILFYEKVFSSLNAIVFVFDLNKYRMVWVNDAFKTILGYKKSTRSIPQNELLDVFHSDDRDFLKEMRNFFRHNKSGTFTAIFKFREISGNYVWLCTSANIFRRTTDESVFEIVGVSIDFTNQLTYNKNLKMLSRQKNQESNKELLGKISKREREILQYFANGYKTKEIAEKFNLSFHTVNNHRKNILRKLQIKNLATLVNFAVENGLA
jgi:PAS domain S-box-containing protein